MPKGTKDKIDFGHFGRRVIEADFGGGDLSSDGGLLLLRQIDRHRVKVACTCIIAAATLRTAPLVKHPG